MFLYLWVPISGACFGSHFGFQTKGATKETIPIQVPVLGPCFGPYQVMTFYQWVDFLRTEADGRGLEIEWLNLDETSATVLCRLPRHYCSCWAQAVAMSQHTFTSATWLRDLRVCCSSQCQIASSDAPGLDWKQACVQSQRS